MKLKEHQNYFDSIINICCFVQFLCHMHFSLYIIKFALNIACENEVHLMRTLFKGLEKLCTSTVNRIPLV